MTTFDAMLDGPVHRTERLDRINARARKMHFGRFLLAMLALPLVLLGRITYGVFAGLWFVTTWIAAAVAEGWSEARAKQLERRGDAGA